MIELLVEIVEAVWWWLSWFRAWWEIGWQAQMDIIRVNLAHRAGGW